MTHLITLKGSKGSGKTLFLAFLSTKIDKKKKIYSNFELFGIPNYIPLTLEVLIELPNNIVVFLDEGYTWLESRISMSALNKLMSYIVFQSRKRNIDIFTTAQMFSSLDVRFREQSDIIITCKAVQDGFKYIIYKRGLRLLKIVIFPYEKAKNYFKYYDTNQVIEPNNKGALEYKIIVNNKKLLKRKIKELVEILKPQLENKKITHDSVKARLIDNEIEMSYEKWIYPYLKGIIEL